jgi:hypothetical protein
VKISEKAVLQVCENSAKQIKKGVHRKEIKVSDQADDARGSLNWGKTLFTLRPIVGPKNTVGKSLQVF